MYICNMPIVHKRIGINNIRLNYYYEKKFVYIRLYIQYEVFDSNFDNFQNLKLWYYLVYFRGIVVIAIKIQFRVFYSNIKNKIFYDKIGILT